MKIKKIYLDVGDTLLYLNIPPGSIYLQILETNGLLKRNLDPTILKNAFSKSWTDMNQKSDPNYRDRYSIHPDKKDGWWKELIHNFLKIVNGEDSDLPDEPVFQEIFQRFDDENLWKIEPTFFELLNMAKKLNISLGIISNWDLRLRGLLERKNLTQYFSPILISAEFGYEKPSELIFIEAQNKANCNADELVYIGDKPELDYYTPHRLGWRAFIIRNENIPEIPTIRNLSEIFSILRET